jgi:hypothetical protein
MNNYLFILRSGEKVPPWRVIFLLIISLSDFERPDTVTATKKDDKQRWTIQKKLRQNQTDTDPDPAFFLIVDPDSGSGSRIRIPVPDPGFDDLKLKKIYN